MQKKSAALLGVAGIALIGIVWFALTVWNEIGNEPDSNDGGPALSIDVIAPKEPEPVRSTGQLAVGELNNGYDHTATMAQATPEAEDPNAYTAWNDDNWANESGLPEQSDKRVIVSDPKEKAPGVTTKVPDGYF